MDTVKAGQKPHPLYKLMEGGVRYNGHETRRHFMINGFFQRKEDEVNYRKEGRLPPGQAITKKFPVLHYGPVPRFDAATWTFKVWGEVEEPVTLSWNEFESCRAPR
jgi:DMSO/TMAO reductase YedYZ molybdopterin-dependent catalytic subunit